MGTSITVPEHRRKDNHLKYPQRHHKYLEKERDTDLFSKVTAYEIENDGKQRSVSIRGSRQPTEDNQEDLILEKIKVEYLLSMVAGGRGGESQPQGQENDNTKENNRCPKTISSQYSNLPLTSKVTPEEHLTSCQQMVSHEKPKHLSLEAVPYWHQAVREYLQGDGSKKRMIKKRLKEIFQEQVVIFT